MKDLRLIELVYLLFLWVTTLQCRWRSVVCMEARLTLALGLSSQPGSIAQAGSLWRAPQRVSRLAAKAHGAAHGELLPQADAVHGHARVTTQAGGVACESQSSSGQLENVNTGNSKTCFSINRFGAFGNRLTGRSTISQNKFQHCCSPSVYLVRCWSTWDQQLMSVKVGQTFMKKKGCVYSVLSEHQHAPEVYMNAMSSDIKLSACYLLLACGSVFGRLTACTSVALNIRVCFCHSLFICFIFFPLCKCACILRWSIFAWLDAPPLGGLPCVCGALEFATANTCKGEKWMLMWCFIWVSFYCYY